MSCVLDHCIEVLRVAAMCNGNSGLQAFQWLPNSTGKPATMPLVERQCVDWEVLAQWSKDRGIGVSPRVMPRPTGDPVRP